MKKITFSLLLLGVVSATNAQVGINTSTLSATLDILSNGNTSATKALEINDNTNKALVNILDNGYVGIGVNSPTEISSSVTPLRLDVNGIARIGEANKSELRLDYGSSTGRAYVLYNNNPADIGNGLSAGSFSIYEKNNAIPTDPEKLRFAITPEGTPSGSYIYMPSNVGISTKILPTVGNTTVPFSTLDVNGSFATNITLVTGGLLDDTHSTVIANSGAGIINLPEPNTAQGRIYTIYLGNASTKTISGNISGTAGNSVSIDNNIGNRGITLQSNGETWVITGRLN